MKENNSASNSLIASPELLSAWRQFDAFPMETLTKAWLLRNSSKPTQRTVEEMAQHRKRFGASGNCFDLAIWLLAELRDRHIEAYAIGNHLGSPDAHVGVISLDGNGRRYLSDLGDLWIQPILIDAADRLLRSRHKGFFTGAEVEMKVAGNNLSVSYIRSNGKQSGQEYDLTPISSKDLWEAGHISQNTLRRPLVEMRIQEGSEIVHWEYENGRSFFSTWSGLHEEPPLATLRDRAGRISAITGMNLAYVTQCLEAYVQLGPVHLGY